MIPIPTPILISAILIPIPIRILTSNHTQQIVPILSTTTKMSSHLFMDAKPKTKKSSARNYWNKTMSTTNTRKTRRSKPTRRKGRRWQVPRSSKDKSSNEMSIRILKLRKSVSTATPDVEGKYMVENWSDVAIEPEKRKSIDKFDIIDSIVMTNIAL